MTRGTARGSFARMTTEPRERMLEVNGIRMRVTEAGEGPLVLLCHGFPELSYSFRHQLPALADAGFRAVAPDMRGYGGTDAPPDSASYSIFHLVGDLVALVSALGEREAVVVGHDWGAPVAWHAAMMRPDVFRAVAGLSVPHRGRAPADPLAVLRQNGLERFYWCYFQAEGVAEAELVSDLETTFRKLFGGLRASSTKGNVLVVPEGGGFLSTMERPDQLPSWLSEAELAVFVRTFERTGFRGGLHWYRNISRNWELTAPYQGAVVKQPALFLGGTRDAVIAGPRGAAALENMRVVVPSVETQLIEGAGHWLQQERPSEVNAALIAFLRSLETRARGTKNERRAATPAQ